MFFETNHFFTQNFKIYNFFEHFFEKTIYISLSVKNSQKKFTASVYCSNDTYTLTRVLSVRIFRVLSVFLITLLIALLLQHVDRVDLPQEDEEGDGE